MIKTRVRVSGFRDLEKELEALAKPADRKRVGRAALREAAEPMADLARSLAPDAPGSPEGRDLAESISVSTRLARRQARMHRKMFRDDRAAVEVFVGAGKLPHAHLQEFGSIHNAPRPYMRPAFDREVEPTLQRLGAILWRKIKQAVSRAERRARRG